MCSTAQLAFLSVKLVVVESRKRKIFLSTHRFSWPCLYFSKLRKSPTSQFTYSFAGWTRIHRITLTASRRSTSGWKCRCQGWIEKFVATVSQIRMFLLSGEIELIWKKKIIILLFSSAEHSTFDSACWTPYLRTKRHSRAEHMIHTGTNGDVFAHKIFVT